LAQTFELEVATPDRLLVREQVSEAQIPAANGYLGILPGHSPLLSLLGPGELSYTVGDRTKSLAVAGGFVEVLPGQVRVLADNAEAAESIDVARAEAALQRAEQRLKKPREKNVDIARALNAFHKAQARLKTAHHK